jgi:hypothetical protein
MERTRSSGPCVLVFSSGNPAATFVAAGLLHGQPTAFGAPVVQGTGESTPTPDVARVLAEIVIELGGWAPQILSRTPDEPFAIGLTICVPT